MKKQIKILALLLHTSLCVFSQATNVSASTDKNGIVIGEQFVLSLKEVLPKGKIGPFFVLDSLPHFEIINKAKPDSIVTDNGILIEQKITLTSWDSGRWPIPALVLNKLKTKPILINVSFAPFNAAQPYHDVKEIIEVKRTPESKWWWYVFGILFLAALFALFFPKEKKKEKTEFIPAGDAYKQAMKKLDQLRSQNTDTDSKMFFTTLVNVFREYLEKRKNIQSFSRTSDDLISQLEKLNLTGSNSSQLIDTLRLSDFVKFAQYHSSVNENNEALEIIRKTIVEIENTKHAV